MSVFFRGELAPGRIIAVGGGPDPAGFTLPNCDNIRPFVDWEGIQFTVYWASVRGVRITDGDVYHFNISYIPSYHIKMVWSVKNS